MTAQSIGIIPAAGSGIRARPYTYELHKGMFLIDGIPNLQRQVDLMRDAMGIEEIVLVLGYMADSIREHFGDGSAFGVRMHYVENRHLDKGWAWSVLLAKPFMAGRNGVVMLADEFYLDTNIGEMASVVLDDFSVVLAVKAVDNPELIKRNYSVERDELRTIRLTENPVSTPNDLLGLGTFAIRSDVMSELEAAYESGRSSLDFVTFVDDLIRGGHQVGSFDVIGEYINLNDVASMEAAQDAAIRSRLAAT